MAGPDLWRPVPTFPLSSLAACFRISLPRNPCAGSSWHVGMGQGSTFIICWLPCTQPTAAQQSRSWGCQQMKRIWDAEQPVAVTPKYTHWRQTIFTLCCQHFHHQKYFIAKSGLTSSMANWRMGREGPAPGIVFPYQWSLCRDLGTACILSCTFHYLNIIICQVNYSMDKFAPQYHAHKSTLHTHGCRQYVCTWNAVSSTCVNLHSLTELHAPICTPMLTQTHVCPSPTHQFSCVQAHVQYVCTVHPRITAMRLLISAHVLCTITGQSAICVIPTQALVFIQEVVMHVGLLIYIWSDMIITVCSSNRHPGVINAFSARSGQGDTLQTQSGERRQDLVGKCSLARPSAHVHMRI